MARSKTIRPADRREQILHHALQLFVANGIQHVSTRQIAQAVGISQPSLYAHFKSRDDIAVELSERAFALFSERMAAAATGGTAIERLRRMGTEYVTFGLEHSAAYRVAFMLERPTGDAARHDAVHQAGMASFQILHDLFREVRGADDDATAARAQSTWASMHGLVALLLARQEFPWVDREMLISLHLDRVCERAFE